MLIISTTGAGRVLIMSMDPCAPVRYELRLGGHLDQHWSTWFSGLVITHDDGGTTTLRGPVTDQSELHGLLAKVRDLGATLISVVPVDTDTTTESATLRASFALLPTLAAPREARVLLGELLTAWAVDALVVEDAGMLVHEVVANVVDHAGTDIALEVDVVAADEWVRVGVADGSSVRPVIRELDPGASRGRGMQIVSSLAHARGSEDHDGGERVWFDLHRHVGSRD